MARDKKISGEGKKGRPDLERMGLFSEASYISAGEPFRQKNGKTNHISFKKNSVLVFNLGIICLVDTSLVNRIKGKQFLTTPTKKGHTNKDSFFEKEFSRIFEVCKKCDN
jgi:hypothetical protein